MRGHPRTATTLAIALAAALAGCGSSGTQPGGFTYESTLTVYSGLPLSGPQAPEMQSIVNGEILALEQAGGRAAKRPISFASLNDSAVAPGTWDGKEPRAAGQDLDAIAYIGDYDSPATAISLPILNENDILQVSPGSPYVGFSDPSPLDQTGEPWRNFPSGPDTFARLVPTDLQEAVAAAHFMRSLGVKSLYVLTDTARGDAPYTAALARALAGDAAADGVATAGPATLNTSPPVPTSSRDALAIGALISAIRSAHADAVFLAAAPDSGAEFVWNSLHRALPRVRLFAPSTLATAPFLQATGSAAGSTYVTSPFLPLADYPASAQRVLSAYRRTFGTAPTALSLYGYEAMASVLAAIGKAGPNAGKRLAVVDAYFHLGWRNSVIGRYRIGTNGDTSLARFAGYRVGPGGRLIYLRTLSG